MVRHTRGTTTAARTLIVAAVVVLGGLAPAPAFAAKPTTTTTSSTTTSSTMPTTTTTKPPSACPPGQTPYPPGACALVLAATSAAPGQPVGIVAGCGYAPGSMVTLKLVPTGSGKTVQLGKLTADGAGCLSGQQFTVSRGAKAGTYLLRADGRDPNGADYQLVSSFVVAASATLASARAEPESSGGSPSSPQVGVAALVLIALGSGFAGISRRGRRLRAG